MIRTVAEGMRADNTSDDKSVAATVRTPPRGFHLMLKVALYKRDTRLKDRCFQLPSAANAQNNRRERGLPEAPSRTKLHHCASVTHGAQTGVPAARCNQGLHLAQ